MVYAPIWKDTYYTTTADTFVYTLSTDGAVIFSGKAYKMPSAANIRININKIAQDYLRQDLDNILTGSTSQANVDACKNFILKNATGGTVETFRFLYDWDYDHNWNNAAATLSEPVNGEYDAAMYKLKTTVSTGSTGTLNTVTTYKNTGNYTKQVCAEYCLLYVNAKGGWDAFAFTGKCRKTDDITQYNFNRAFDNNTREFESGRYISEIVENYELNTGILTQAQARLFAKHLIGSNNCYLQNTVEGWVKPAVITENKATYKLEGDEDVITYTINVKLSQSKVRQ